MSETKEPESTPNNKRLQTGNIDNYNYEILSEDYTSFDMSFKLIVIGDSGVGKSCLTNNAIKNTFDDAYNATVGFEFFTFNIRFNGKVVKLQIWDTCGQELYRSLITNFYRNSSLAVIVYAINSKDSFEDIEMWLRELRTHSSPDVKVFLIGNKVDLEDEREVRKEDAEAFCKENNINLFMESSAKTGFNAQNIFIKAAEVLYQNYLEYNEKNEDQDNLQDFQANSTTINNKKNIKNNGGCC